jgi:glutamine synthetase
MGIVKSVAIPLHQFEDACMNGKWFDGSSIEGFARIAESDMFLVPDLSTWAVDALGASRGEHGTRNLLGVHPNGDLFEATREWC